ncbi:hypothetical protein RN001_015814 [Aquatica leii]|uniref:Uncharacterized protein n=1 Tax=Aquatica leii TaxID=1421715 RepID=A0AAN7NTQ1_9COLE|nr:hypothetical protein RN001_015814 [Aquatica leii]
MKENSSKIEEKFHENLQKIEELQTSIKNQGTNTKEIEILKFPCHTQAVERCIKLVTEASSLVCGAEARDGFIRARISSRTAMPKFNTKSEFFKTL